MQLWNSDQPFSHAQLKMTIYLALLDKINGNSRVCTFLREETKPTIVTMGNRKLTRFFLTKAIPPFLWNACDYVQNHFPE